MQFKHPEILYALFLLILPIIVHLFQLRKFKKVAFTNVQFLKKIDLQTRKSSNLKKYLVLLSRLLLFSAIIIAFAQPYFSKTIKNNEQHTYIYLDNSLSMQAKGSQGELFKRAIQDIIENNKVQKNIHLFTNNNQWNNLKATDLKNVLLSLDYFPVKQELKSVLLKINNASKNKKNTSNNIILISDFQNINFKNKIDLDSAFTYNLIQVKPVEKSNINIDSVYISSQNNEVINLKVIVKNQNAEAKKLPISLYNDKVLIGKSTVDILENTDAKVTFTVPANTIINGKITTTDDNLVFDNDLYFSINQTDKINVLAIGKNNAFLSKIYTKQEFNFISNKATAIDYSLLSNQNLIVLNELENIPTSLSNSISKAVKNGVNLVIIPNTTSNIDTYNTLLKTVGIGGITSKKESSLAITDINFAHPFLKNVFENQVKNFQYPVVNSYFDVNFKNSSSILKYENESTFVSQIKTANSTVYFLTSAINNENSNFKNSPLIVPIFYNFGKYSYKNSQLNYTIGNTNEIEIKAILQKDAILQIANAEKSFIPLQQVSSTSVKITTTNEPLKSGFYTVTKQNDKLKNIAFNYNRQESILAYVDIKNYTKNKQNFNYYTSVKDAFTTINNEYETSNYWKLFLILALLFLVIEILLLKFLKP